jgi:hypothetical protein
MGGDSGKSMETQQFNCREWVDKPTICKEKQR